VKAEVVAVREWAALSQSIDGCGQRSSSTGRKTMPVLIAFALKQLSTSQGQMHLHKATVKHSFYTTDQERSCERNFHGWSSPFRANDVRALKSSPSAWYLQMGEARVIRPNAFSLLPHQQEKDCIGSSSAVPIEMPSTKSGYGRSWAKQARHLFVQ
jgi:hypothetical protein